MYYFVVVFKGEKIKIRESPIFLSLPFFRTQLLLFILLPLMLEIFHLSTAKLVNDQELQNWGTVAMEELHSPYFLSGKIVQPPIFEIFGYFWDAHCSMSIPEISQNLKKIDRIGALWQ